jgi:hypothetical protein
MRPFNYKERFIKERGDSTKLVAEKEVLKATGLALLQGTEVGDNWCHYLHHGCSLKTYLLSKLEQGCCVSPRHRGTAATLQPHHPRVFPPAAPQSEGGLKLRGPQSADGRYSTPHNWSSRFRSDVACTAQGCYLFT